MSEGSSKLVRTDVAVLILMLGVLVGGFWITGRVIYEKTAELQRQEEVIHNSVLAQAKELGELRKSIDEFEKKLGAKHAAAQPAAEAKTE